MLILGLLLVVVSGVAAVVLIASNTGGATQTVSAFGRDLADVTMAQAFVAGLVVALVFALGVWLLMAAGRRGREHRARYRDARREARDAARERDDLADRLRKEDEVRAEREAGTRPAPPVGPAAEGERTEAMPAVAPTDPAARPVRHSTRPGGDQPVITNIHEGPSPTR